MKALVLAGSRGGSDPVADYAGVGHKALITLQGRTLLRRVIDALRDAGATQIAVSCNDPAVALEADAARADPLPPTPSPSQSVLEAADELGTPLLVTTADHALLEGEWVRRFLADIPPGTDVAALMAERAVIERDAPGTRRTYLRLADGHWSGCNLFYLATPRSLAVIELWKRVEAERKRPWRMARLLGWGMLLRYVTGRLTLADAGKRLGELAGVNAVVVASPFGLAAVDVDKPADLDLVRKLRP